MKQQNSIKWLVLSIAAASACGAMQTHSAVLEEVVVTAQKRAESLQEIPISIVAMGEEQLLNMGIDELKDIESRIPSLVITPFTNDATSLRLTIRGVGAQDLQLTQDPSVALYMDGIYIGTTTGAALEVVDLERLEVLRGPQGTLYGRNATGGAINLIPVKPELGKFGFRQSFTVGNYDAFKSKTSVNIPLGDKAALRLAYLFSERDGIVENLGEGEDWGVQDREAGRVDLRLQPTDKFMIDYAYDLSVVKDTSNFQQVAEGATGGIISTSAPITKKRLDKARAFQPIRGSDVETKGHTLTLNYDLNESLTLRSITGFREMDSQFFHDGVPTLWLSIPTPAGVLQRTLQITNTLTDFEQFSQEFNVLGTALEGRLEYVAGLYYYEDESSQDQQRLAGFVPVTSWPLSLTESENDSKAVFGQFSYIPESMPSWKFTVGARYSADNRKAFRINETSPSFIALGGAEVVGAGYDEDFSNFNPSVTVTYFISEDVNVYAKYATGYKSGGTSQRSSNPENFAAGFDEEEIVAWELGLKGDFFNSRMNLSAAAFSMEIDGFQSSVQTGATAGDRDFFGVDETTIDGFEIDIKTLLTDNLELSVSYSYLDTEMGERGANIITDTGQVLNATFIENIPFAPEQTISTALDYRVPVRFGEFQAHIGYAYQDEAATSLNSGDNLPIDSRGLLDATISLANISVWGGTAKISIWGSNLTDEEYLVNNTHALAPLGLEAWSTYGVPRMYGATFSYQY